MSFTISPGVSIREIDLTTSIEAANSIEGSLVGKFTWGPVLERVLVANEDELVNRFGSPTADNYVDFFSGAQFLSYTNKLRVVRIGDTTLMKNAADAGSGVKILNDEDYEDKSGTLGTFAWIAKYPGDLGNSLGVATCTTADEFEVTLPGAFVVTRGSKVATYTPAVAELLADFFNVGDFLVVDNTRYAVESIDSGVQLTLVRAYAGSATPTTFTRLWQYGVRFGAAPDTNEIHVVVVDVDGEFTNEVGTILEEYGNLSTVAGTLFEDGSAAYYVTAINRRSDFIRVGEASVTGLNPADKVVTVNLINGEDDFANIGDSEYLFGYDLFTSAEEVDAPLFIGADANTTRANYLISNIAELRKDSIIFLSPEFADVVNNSGSEVTDSIDFRNTLPSTSYSFMDSGWGYLFDKYNDTFRWIPLNGGTAGLASRTERERDAWFSPAGFNRGGYKNLIKLAYSPDQPQRDDLYTNNINPVTDFPGDGITLFGDRTLLAKSSAFREIGVRRLFIVLETAIAKASKLSLFEFNDEFTRSQFISQVEPFLREVKGRRGIEDFRVVADETVNTPQIINSQRFVGQIYVKPLRSINFIRLDFIAVRSGVEFSEVVGQV